MIKALFRVARKELPRAVGCSVFGHPHNLPNEIAAPFQESAAAFLLKYGLSAYARAVPGEYVSLTLEDYIRAVFERRGPLPLPVAPELRRLYEAAHSPAPDIGILAVCDCGRTRPFRIAQGSIPGEPRAEPCLCSAP